MDGKRSNVTSVNTENSGVPIPENHRLPAYALPPWPEWSDEIVTNFDWTGDGDQNSENRFTDPTGTILPPNITAAQWILPSDLFIGPPKLISPQQPPTLDLISPNAHLCEDSKIIRHILSEISELYELCYIGNCPLNAVELAEMIANGGSNPYFPFEGENVAFVANSDGNWKPWDHIYSLCPAGVKGEKAKFNPSGRYLVRLYYMGCWRMITVDDRIPLLPHGIFGLPMTNNLELWPLILTKALLKVASLSWDSPDVIPCTGPCLHESDGDTQIKYFSTISCLTGWVFEWQNIRQPVVSHDLWNYLQNVLPKYKRGRTTGRNSSDFDETDKMFNLENPTEATTPSTGTVNSTGSNFKNTNNESARDSNYSEGGNELQISESQSTNRGNKGHGGRRVKTKGGDSSGIPSDGDPSADDDRLSTASKRNAKKNTKLIRESPKISTMAQKIPGGVAKDTPSPGQQAGPGGTDLKEGSGTVAPSVLSLDPEMQSILANNKKKKNTQSASSHTWQSGESIHFGEMGQHHELRTIQEIIKSLQEFKGPLQHSAMKKLEHQMSMDKPTSITAVFETFPPDEKGNSKGIPPHLFHPVQFAQIRDEPLSRNTCSPPTPRWKAFRWKKWAMKKGLIPMDETFTNKVIKSVLSKTPFTLKNWEASGTKASMRQDSEDLTYDMVSFSGDLEDKMNASPHLKFPIAFKIPAEANLQDLKVLLWGVTSRPSPPGPPGTALDALLQVRKSRSTESKSGVSSVGWKGRGADADPALGVKGKKERKSKDGLRKPHGKKHNGQHHDGTHTPVHNSTVSDPKSFAPSKAAHKHDKNNKVGSKPIKSNKKEKGKGHPSKSRTGVDSGNESLSGFKGDRDPAHACDEFWMDIEDIAQNLYKICKFYKTSSQFGTCYIIQRGESQKKVPSSPKEARSSKSTEASGNSAPIESNPVGKIPSLTTAPKSSSEPTDSAGKTVSPKKADKEAESVVVEDAEVTKTIPQVQYIDVMDWQMENLDDLDAGFYIFSDCWTEQQLIFSLEVLHQSSVTSFENTVKNVADTPVTGPAKSNTSSDSQNKNTNGRSYSKSTTIVPETLKPITVIVKPWDWRHDCCLEGNVIVISTNKHSVIHLPLPPGRNLFRLWILDESSDPISMQNKDIADFTRKMESNDLTPPQSPPMLDVLKSHFSLKIVSNTPIKIGGREAAQDLMTDLPSLFSRQCDILARSVWSLLLSFGHSRNVTGKAFQVLRQSYCSSFPASKAIQKTLLKVHEDFDSELFGMLFKFNGNQMDRKMLLALRTLLLNPNFGSDALVSLKHQPSKKYIELMRQREEVKKTFALLKCRLESRICPKILECAAQIIQRYWRGWLTRRLLQYRRRRHKHFQSLENQIRKVALLLAENDTSRLYGKNPGLSIVLDPPSWAMDLMECLLGNNPWLVTVLPLAHSIPFHVKIKDVVGEMPVPAGTTDWLPFYRQRLDTRGESNWTMCQLEFRTYPNEAVFMDVIDNDTSKSMLMANQRLFVGKLPTNELGYTVLGYKLPCLETELGRKIDREILKSWKFRIIFPAVQHPPLILGDTQNLEEFTAKRLTLNRFSGYYIPNDDLCICRYTVDITGDPAYISIRFKASNENAQLRLQIWNAETKEVVVERRATGGFLLPSIRLAAPQPRASQSRQSNPRPWDEKCDHHHCHNVTILNSYLQHQDSVEKIPQMSTNSEQYGEMDEDALPPLLNAPTHQQYVVGVFLENKSWPLTDAEWKFVQYQTKKFWNKMLVFRDLAHEYDRKMEVDRKKRRVKMEAKKLELQAKSNKKLVKSTSSLTGRSFRGRQKKYRRENVSGSENDDEDDAEYDGESDDDGIDGVPAIESDADTATSGLQSNRSNVTSSTMDKAMLPPKGGESARAQNGLKTSANSTIAARSSGPKIKGMNKKNVHVHAKNAASGEKTGRSGSRELRLKDKESKSASGKKIRAATVPKVKRGRTHAHLPLQSAAGISNATSNSLGGSDFSASHHFNSFEPETETTFIQKERKWLKVNSGDEEDTGVISDEEEFPKEQFVSANLTVVEGGPDSQKIDFYDEPHWIIEILTDSDQAFQFTSNRRLFQEKLIQTKKEWESQDAGRYIRGRQARHEFLAKNLVPVNLNQEQPFASVGSGGKFYSCLFLDKNQLDGLNYDDWHPSNQNKDLPFPEFKSKTSVHQTFSDTAVADRVKDSPSSRRSTALSREIKLRKNKTRKSISKVPSAAPKNTTALKSPRATEKGSGSDPKTTNVKKQRKNKKSSKSSSIGISVSPTTGNTTTKADKAKKVQQTKQTKKAKSKANKLRDEEASSKETTEVDMESFDPYKGNDVDDAVEETSVNTKTLPKINTNMNTNTNTTENTTENDTAEEGEGTADDNFSDLDALSSKAPSSGKDCCGPKFKDVDSEDLQQDSLVVTSPSQDEVINENERFLFPPIKGPTHILFGPELQKCGRTEKCFSIEDRQLLTDIQGDPYWSKSVDFQCSTGVKVREWNRDLERIKENMKEKLMEQERDWRIFNENITANVFCELERNRAFLEKFRTQYLEQHELRLSRGSSQSISTLENNENPIMERQSTKGFPSVSIIDTEQAKESVLEEEKKASSVALEQLITSDPEMIENAISKISKISNYSKS